MGFNFDGEYFYASGHILTQTHKNKNIIEASKVSFVIGDLQSSSPGPPECSRHAEPQA